MNDMLHKILLCNFLGILPKTPRPSRASQLVQTSTLDVVHRLKEDADQRVAESATRIFEGVVPRIWSC